MYGWHGTLHNRISELVVFINFDVDADILGLSLIGLGIHTHDLQLSLGAQVDKCRVLCLDMHWNYLSRDLRVCVSLQQLLARSHKKVCHQSFVFGFHYCLHCALRHLNLRSRSNCLQFSLAFVLMLFQCVFLSIKHKFINVLVWHLAEILFLALWLFDNGSNSF